jgi:hypothetical protein
MLRPVIAANTMGNKVGLFLLSASLEYCWIAIKAHEAHHKLNFLAELRVFGRLPIECNYCDTQNYLDQNELYS